jgi:hypothetical protein
LVSLRLIGTEASVPEPADAVAALQAGVHAATGDQIAMEQLGVVASGPGALTCLVSVVWQSRQTLLATVRRVDGQWSLAGLQ